MEVYQFYSSDPEEKLLVSSENYERALTEIVKVLAQENIPYNVAVHLLDEAKVKAGDKALIKWGGNEND